MARREEENIKTYIFGAVWQSVSMTYIVLSMSRRNCKLNPF